MLLRRLLSATRGTCISHDMIRADREVSTTWVIICTSCFDAECTGQDHARALSPSIEPVLNLPVLRLFALLAGEGGICDINVQQRLKRLPGSHGVSSATGIQRQHAQNLTYCKGNAAHQNAIVAYEVG